MSGGGHLQGQYSPSSRPVDASELVSFMGAIGRDYAATIRLTASLAPTDRRRVLSKTRGRYRRLLAETLTTTEWLSGTEVAP